ncbi:MAG: hypothetical protein ACFBWO_05960 [Paracoccaceae bacterium]
MATTDPARAARRFVALACAATALAGCQVQTTAGAGLSERDAELDRVKAAEAGVFRLRSASPRRAVIEAAGRAVTVVPAPETCLAEDAIDLSERSAFLLITDCAMVQDAPQAAGAGEGRLARAPSFPGLVTLSLAAEPRGAIADLLAFLETEAGRALLARAEDAAPVAIRETREIGGALYVHARQEDEAASPLLSRDFWRAFVDIGGRMGVVTVSGFGAGDIGHDTMFGEAHRQVVALTTAGQGASLTAKTVAVEVPDLGAVETRGGE